MGEEMRIAGMEVQREEWPKEKVVMGEGKRLAKTMETKSDSRNILDQKRGSEKENW